MTADSAGTSRLCSRSFSSDPVKLAVGPPVILIRRAPSIFAPPLKLMFEVQLGFIVKSILNLDLSEGEANMLQQIDSDVGSKTSGGR